MAQFGIRRLRSCFKWGWPLVAGLTIVALGLAIFGSLARAVTRQRPFGFDDAILTWLSEVASPGLTRLMLAASDSATAWFLVPLLVLLAVLWWRGQKNDWIALTVSLAGATILNQIAKAIFERARPTLFPHLQEAGGYSFPSGHSQTAVAFYVVLAYIIARQVAPKWRIPIYILGGAWALVIGLSRNYLGVHYPSDVLAAFAATLPWALAVIFVHQCYAPAVVGEEKIIKPVPESGRANPEQVD